MKNMKFWRTALVATLVLTVMLSVTGGTIAWFTDSVTSANNVISAGNLDVELYYQVNGQSDWTKVEANTNVFKADTLWEPGHTEVVKLKVVNEGNLALKAKLGVNVASETGSTNKANEEFKLSDYIKFGIGDETVAFDRDAAIKAVDTAAVTVATGYTSEYINLLAKSDADTDEKIVTMVVYMPTTVGNEANHAKDAAVPTINLGVKLEAYQLTYESDSFDNQYDVLADLPAEIAEKLKNIADGLYQYDEQSNYYVTNANGLSTLNSMMADKSAGRDAIVNIITDIDFTGKTWTPVDSHADTAFEIAEINGNGHTISNMTINGQAMFTRFAGSGDVVIKDITFDNANVNSNGKINTSILTVHSYQNVLLDNVDVKNSTISGGYKVAPLLATVYNEDSSTVTATLKNCDVSNTTVKATSYDFCTTGMVAFVYADDNDKIEFENCTVSNVKLIAPNDSYKAHAAIYTTGSETLFNEAEGVTVTNVTFEALQ